MKRTAKAIGMVAIVMAVAIGLGGCNTLRGIGKDASIAGHAIKGTCKRIF